MTDFFDYAEAQLDGDQLIREFAAQRRAFVIAKNRTGGDDWNPTFGAPTVTQVQAVETFAEKSQVDGSRIEADARVVAISAEGLSITIDETLQFNFDGTLAAGELTGGTTFEIVKVKPLNPAGTVVFYECQVK